MVPFNLPIQLFKFFIIHNNTIIIKILNLQFKNLKKSGTIWNNIFKLFLIIFTKFATQC